MVENERQLIIRPWESGEDGSSDRARAGIGYHVIVGHSVKYGNVLHIFIDPSQPTLRSYIRIQVYTYVCIHMRDIVLIWSLRPR